MVLRCALAHSDCTARQRTHLPSPLSSPLPPPPPSLPPQVTAVHKANIMKLGDGMFLKAVREVAQKFPTIE